MTREQQPSDIAREALKLLAARKLSPTPANYQQSYNEIAALPNTAGFPEAQLRRIAFALTARKPTQQEQLDLLDAAIGRHSWQGIEDALVALVKLAAVPAPAGDADCPQSSEVDVSPDLTGELYVKLAHLIESMLPALADDDAHFSEQVECLLHVLRDRTVDAQTIKAELDIFGQRLAFVSEEQVEIKQALLKLLQLIIENISTLVMEDSWLSGQISALLDAIAPPLSLRRLDEVERRLRDLMEQQAVAKKRSLEAQEEMRQMLGAFIQRLSAMNESSTTFQHKIEQSARQIEQVARVEELAPLLKEVIDATRAMADETSEAREQLHTLEGRVLSTEAEIAQLHLELSSASAMARHDPLTDALNRKGLDEALTRELANMRRRGAKLSLALLDIDNFKKINDRLGHETGDAALLHLVKVVRACLRPQDSLARYGGEEFVILMPETVVDAAVMAMARLQRELTKNFFLANNEKILITFSAGVAQLMPGESGADVIKRADQAMYLAKRAGKNRVVCG